MTKSVSFHPVPGQKHQERAMRALAKGVMANGDRVVDDGDIRVSWNLPRFDDGRPVLVLEAGYINGSSGDYTADRLRFVSTGWNGLHGHALSYGASLPMDRWEKYGLPLEDWDATREGVNLILNQHPNDSCSPKPDQWRFLTEQIQMDFGNTVVRHHPLVVPKQRPLREALSEAARCFTWNSTAAIEAVCMGIPTWTFDRGSMAWSVSRHTMRDFPFLEDRTIWASHLAYRQWTHEELESGEAWAHLKSYPF